MKSSLQFSTLIDLAESIGITIRRVPWRGDGGEDRPRRGGALVRLKDREILFLDPGASFADQIAVLGEALHDRPEIEQRFVPPEIRQLIDRAGGE